jgi:hypothetical protein
MNEQWSVKVFNPMLLPFAVPRLVNFSKEFRELDALKMSAMPDRESRP